MLNTIYKFSFICKNVLINGSAGGSCKARQLSKCDENGLKAFFKILYNVVSILFEGFTGYNSITTKVNKMLFHLTNEIKTRIKLNKQCCILKRTFSHTSKNSSKKVLSLKK